ncbi:sterigmatocystin 8-O-methyltransferase [Xylaria flabelliformis]|nr:sterigmatocystin 8-O-methyltransferase [Xylaria flabelliformis]
MSPILDTATTLVNELSSLASQVSFNTDQNARNKALQLGQRLVAELEQPENTAVDLAFSPLVSVAARIAVDLELFKHISSTKAPINSKELSSLSGGEELFIIRILRPLSSIGFVKEVGERTWESTPITHAMVNEGIAAGHRVVGEMVVSAATKAPRYFKEAGYHCPTNPRDGLTQYAFQTKLSAFQLYSSMPRILKDFNMFMGNTMGARSYWIDWYPVHERLINGSVQELPLLVDVGGGKGHDLLAFHEKYPAQGRLVLQDLATVIDGIQNINPIETVGYDFFTEQPIRGARAYFYHHILHDWSDDICLEILKQVRNAMKPGYSKLLIHEMIIPEQGASKFHALLDLTMMTFNAGMERTEIQWEELLQKAGLKVVKFWTAQADADGIVEAVLDE